MRKKFFKLVEPTEDRKDINYYFDVFIMSLIILNVIALILASDQKINQKFSVEFYVFEVFSVIVFSVEYLIRLWTCVEKDSFIGIRSRGG
jgi:voltage-gated potassium channel